METDILMSTGHPLSDEELIRRYIEQNPNHPGRANVRIVGYGTPVWALIGHLEALEGDAAQLAGLAAAGAARLAALRRPVVHDVLDGESLLRTLIDHMPDQIYAKDVNGRFLIANRAAARRSLG